MEDLADPASDDPVKRESSRVQGAKANYEKHKELYQRFSPYNHISKDDPPLFLNYGGNASVPARSIADGIHHAMFGIKLKEKS